MGDGGSGSWAPVTDSSLALDYCGKICALGTSFVLASGLINISHSVNQTHQSPSEKEKCASLGIILGFHAFILVFYFDLVNFLGF